MIMMIMTEDRDKIMGFLRKLGKKIKKRVKKLFSSKIGAFLGSIALSMILGPMVSKAFNGIKGVFTGTAQAGAGVGAGAGAGATGSSVNIISDTVSGSLEKLANTNGIQIQTTDMVRPTLKSQIAQGKEFLNPKFKDLTLGDKLKVAGQKTKDFLIPDTSSVKDFAADITKSVGQQYVMGAFQEEPVDEGGYGIMPNVGSMEAPQAQYVQTVKNEIPNLQATNFQQLNQSLLYGTLSPQYLMGQYQS